MVQRYPAVLLVPDQHRERANEIDQQSEIRAGTAQLPRAGNKPEKAIVQESNWNSAVYLLRKPSPIHNPPLSQSRVVSVS